MEEVEILPRDAYLHTINVVQAPCTIQWWFSTKRKNIDFGLFQRAGSDSGSHTGSRESSVGTTTGRRMAALQHESEGLWGAAEVAAKQRGGYFKLQDRNVVELMGLRHYESSKTTIKGSWQVEEPGTYVLYFDNSFSKNTSKRLSFCVAVKEVRQGSAASSGRPAVMSGWLLKKKRKRMQGWARRWITLQGQWLLYSTTEGGIPRARVDIYSAVVSTSRADRTLTIDGDEGFLQLRAQTDVAFDAWVAALKKTKEMYMLGSVGDGATLSGAVMGSPREDSLAQVQQAHVVFETSVDQLVQLLGALGEVPDAAFHEHMEGVVQQIRNSEAVLHGAAKAAATAAAAGAGIMRHDTDPCGRPSLSATDTQMSVFSGSAAASDVFYDTNEVLELARDDSDQMPPLGAGTDNTGTLDVDSDDVSDSDDEYFGGPRAPQTDRMRRDLVRDPDFIEALAQNKLRGSTTSASARSGTAAAAAAADEVTKDVASGLDGRLVATIERVREQLDGFESRITLPAEAGEVNVSLLSILRKNVGKDLSNIAMPLTMNEPLNALQTLCEELTYSVLLQRANEMDDSLDRLMHVAAFAISALSLKKSRVERKPFNPLLGETYELVDPRSEFRFIAEKVSHHPPVMACHADAPGFRLWQDSSGRSRFWGKSIELVQTSHMHIELPRHADHFTYAKPSALVRGLLAGSRTIDFTGEITILNRSTGDRCVVLFKEGGIFSPSNDAVECRLFRAGSDHAERVLRGSWSAELLYERSPARSDVLWAAAALPPDAARFYFFSYFAMRLNELPPPPLRGELPLTDTRFRPDQRAYEEGRLEEAEELKTRLEDAQRVRNRERAAAGTSWVPLWFELREDSDSQSGHAWAYKGGYWEARARHAFPPSLPLWDDPNNSGSLIGLSN